MKCIYFISFILIGCDTKLFHGRDKFVSACGWPAFTAPARLNNAKNEAASASSRLDDLLKQSEDPLKYVIDSSFGMRRVEARCRTCDSHLGHVFEEPGWTRESCGGAAASDLRNALRYCINSVCLSFRPE